MDFYVVVPIEKMNLHCIEQTVPLLTYAGKKDAVCFIQAQLNIQRVCPDHFFSQFIFGVYWLFLFFGNGILCFKSSSGSKRVNSCKGVRGREGICRQ